MSNILILYPQEFSCYSKFHRKVKNIISSLDNVTLVFPSDKSGHISKFCEEYQSPINIREYQNWSISNVTHAIIFDDGEVFEAEKKLLEQHKIPLRFIKIQITRVINIKKETQFGSKKSTNKYEYIGRGSYWGNPHSMYENGDSREEVIRKFKYDFDNEMFPNKKKSEVYKLAGKRLGCFCKPKACHGDILADFLNAWDDGK